MTLFKCTCCRKQKNESEYYIFKDKIYGYRRRPECTVCTLKRRRVKRNKKLRDRLWNRNPKKQAYQKEYMKRNAEKMKVYRKRFLERNPHYYREYMRKRRKALTDSKYALNERDIA